MTVQTVTGVVERDPDGTWHYVHVPREVRAAYASLQRRGAVAVTVTLGASTWDASILPWADGSGQVSVGRAVRRREGVEAGDEVTLRIEPRHRRSPEGA